MNLTDIILIAVALSMDAFAVSICKGLSVQSLRPRHMLIAGLYFGGFQALMPLLGYYLGYSFKDYITSIDHWIAFGLLAVIGINMLREALGGEEDEAPDDRFSPRAMLPLAVATSIDALAVGVGFAFLGVNIAVTVSLIGVITLILSALGVYIGNIFGMRYKKPAELAGGAVLVLIGLKILLEHLGVI